MSGKIIIYYSMGGNTRKIARMIADETGANIAEIKTVKPYKGSYNEIVEQGHSEVDSGFEPEIQPFTADLNKYDTVYLGTPVWWYTYAPAMKTFLSNTDLSGKTIYPFATNGGWIGHTFEDIKKACAGADVKDGLNVYFSANKLKTSENKIKSWIKQ